MKCPEEANPLRQTGDCQGLGEGGLGTPGGSFRGDETILELDTDYGCTHFECTEYTELYSLKWLTLSSVSFPSISKYEMECFLAP